MTETAAKFERLLALVQSGKAKQITVGMCYAVVTLSSLEVMRELFPGQKVQHERYKGRESWYLGVDGVRYEFHTPLVLDESVREEVVL